MLSQFAEKNSLSWINRCYYLMLISCHFKNCKALSHVMSITIYTRTLTFLTVNFFNRNKNTDLSDLFITYLVFCPVQLRLPALSCDATWLIIARLIEKL